MADTKKPATVVVATRVPVDVADALYRQARECQTTVADILRAKVMEPPLRTPDKAA